MMKKKVVLALATLFLISCQNSSNQSSISVSQSSQEVSSLYSSSSSISESQSLSEESTITSLILDEPIYYFLGSSVTYGHTTGGVSFVEMIDTTLNCQCVKSAVSGTTLTDNGSSSYVQRMKKMDETKTVEHFIVQLSTNDVTQNKPFGEISASDDLNDFDTRTVIGAMEYIISYVQIMWECDVTFYTNPNFNNNNYQNLITKLYELQDKWGIGIIDFYNYEGMEALDSTTLRSYMSDSIHPNTKGYKWMAQEMSKYLKDEYERKHPGHTNFIEK